MRQAVILAAGCGRRLGSETGGRPKCLLSVGGKTLIERQLEALEEIGIDKVCVVAGFGADEVRAQLDGRCSLILNRRWADTNSLYSLWLTREWVRGELFLFNSDVLAHIDVYRRIAAAPSSCLAFDSSSGHDGEHMKVWIDGGDLRAISKCLPAAQISGENVGILRFAPRVAQLVLGAADALVTNGGRQAWAPAAIDSLVPQSRIRCVDVSDLPWVEIDCPDDLRTAREIVWPAIRGQAICNPPQPRPLPVAG
ncbi:MAG: phosphocholine cytidylyltransferase family protein [Thermoanaerobaculia bacterium]